MTINEIAKVMNDCAEEKCDQCKYKNEIGIYNDCQAILIEDLGRECRILADQMGDDGK